MKKKKIKIKVWYVSYSKKDGPFFSKKDANDFNSAVHGGWGEVKEEVVLAEKA